MGRDLSILVSGAGIAGLVAAYWLLEANPEHTVTILERSPTLPTNGQSIDLRDAAVGIIRKMGLEKAIRDRCTHEAGLQFVDDDGGVVATFPASRDASHQSFTSEYEILRGDLVGVLFESVKDRVRTVFGDRIVEYSEQGDGKVAVTLASGETGSYDLLLACDGQGSRVRHLALGTVDDRRRHLVPFCNYAAYFTMRNDDHRLVAADKMARWYNAPGGRIVFLRPDTRPDLCRANLIRQLPGSDAEGNARYRAAIAAGPEAMKAVLWADFQGMGWETDAVLAGLRTTTDFYASETAQVRAPTLTVSRVALVGDAGYCPSPLTGMGTSLAIIGAYVLAGEVSLQADDVEAALRGYNGIMLPYARKVQNIPISLPQWANPQSAWGVAIQRAIMRFICWSGLAGLVAWIADAPVFQKKEFELGSYAWDAKEE